MWAAPATLSLTTSGGSRRVTARIHGPSRACGVARGAAGRCVMAESIRRVQYFYVMAPDKPGEGARALKTLSEAGVNLLAFSGFPAGKRAQLDFIPENP